MTVESRTLSGREKIWYASLSLKDGYAPGKEPLQLPDDGLASLLTDPWKTLNPVAALPTDKPVTMLFLYTEKGDGELGGTLIAEGITGTTFITVREAQVIVTARAMALTADAKAEPPSYYRGLQASDQPIEVVTVGKLAYAHYHLSDEKAKIMAFRYAICRDPRYMVTFLNEKARESGLGTQFSVVVDGSFRVIYQTDTDGPVEETAVSGKMGPVIGDPCIKLTGTTDDQGNFVIDSMMFVRYRATPEP